MTTRGRAWRGAGLGCGRPPLIGVALLVVLGAGCAPERRPTPPRARASKPDAKPTKRHCPGGLLCEATETLLGWRVPEGCAQRHVRPELASCVLADADWPRLVEFYRSRYPQIEELDGGLRLIGPSPGPGRSPPMLRALARGAGVELLLLPGDPAAPPSQAPATKPGSVP